MHIGTPLAGARDFQPELYLIMDENAASVAAR